MRPSSRLRLAIALLACVPALAACGGSGTGSGGSDPDPAKAVAAGVPFYVESVVQPSDAQAEDVRALIKQVAKIDDPGAELERYIKRESAKDGKAISYEKDVKPWLGKRVGFGISDLQGESATFVAAVGVKDADKAKTFVADQSKGDKKGSYEDTTYYEDSGEETVVGVAGDYLVLTEHLPEFKAAVDQIDKGKGSLADAQAFDDATKSLPDERLATFYLNVRTFADALASDPSVASGAAGPALKQAFAGIKGVSGALTAAEDRAVFETRVSTDGKANALSALGPGAAPGLVREAPADSLVVYGVKDLGQTYKTALATVAGAFGGAALQSQLSKVGIDLDRDLFSWIGDTTVFVRGTDASNFDGAVMIDATDTAAAAAAIPRLIGVARQQGGLAFGPASIGGADQAFSATIPGAPSAVFVARKGKRVVIALGEDAARAGLTPSSTIDANGAYDKAKQATDGYDPSMIVDVQRLVELAGRSAGSDPDFQRAKPYLEALSLLVLGSKRDGDTFVSRVALTVG